MTNIESRKQWSDCEAYVVNNLVAIIPVYSCGGIKLSQFRQRVTGKLNITFIFPVLFTAMTAGSLSTVTRV